MAVKDIDPVDVKQAIKNNQLHVYVRYNHCDNAYRVYLQDNRTEETVLLIDFSEEKIKKSWT